MKKYHFQENEKDFGSTVRLDAINDKVKEIKKKEETDELGDANEFLNVFESEKFDVFTLLFCIIIAKTKRCHAQLFKYIKSYFSPKSGPIQT